VRADQNTSRLLLDRSLPSAHLPCAITDATAPEQVRSVPLYTRHQSDAGTSPVVTQLW